MSSKKPKNVPVLGEATSLHLYGLRLDFDAINVLSSWTQEIIVDVVIDDMSEPGETRRVVKVWIDGDLTEGSDIKCSGQFLDALDDCIKDALNTFRLGL